MRFWLQIFKSRVYESTFLHSIFSVRLGGKAVLMPSSCLFVWLYYLFMVGWDFFGVLEDLCIFFKGEEVCRWKWNLVRTTKMCHLMRHLVTGHICKEMVVTTRPSPFLPTFAVRSHPPCELQRACICMMLLGSQACLLFISTHETKRGAVREVTSFSAYPGEWWETECASHQISDQEWKILIRLSLPSSVGCHLESQTPRWSRFHVTSQSSAARQRQTQTQEGQLIGLATG